MKKILAFILTAAVCISLISCNLGANVEDGGAESAEATSASAEASAADDENASKITNLAGKTPIEAYRAAEEWIISCTNFEMLVNTSTATTYNSAMTSYNFDTLYN